MYNRFVFNSILKYCDGLSINIYDIFGNIITVGHLSLFKYYISNLKVENTFDKSIEQKIFDLCGYYGQLDMIRWMHNNDMECTENCMDWAAEKGHLNVVKWLHYNRKHKFVSEGCTTHAMDHSAGNGHFDIVCWLHYNRTEGCTGLAIDLATKYNHFEIVKWLCDFRHEGFTINAFNWIDNNNIEFKNFLHKKYTRMSFESNHWF